MGGGGWEAFGYVAAWKFGGLVGFGVEGFVDSWRVWSSLGSGILELRVIKGFRAMWLWIESLESSLVAMLGDGFGV